MKTHEMIQAAERVRAIYVRDRDKVAERPGREDIIAKVNADIAAIDQLLSYNGDFFEYLAGELYRSGVA